MGDLEEQHWNERHLRDGHIYMREGRLGDWQSLEPNLSIGITETEN